MINILKAFFKSGLGSIGNIIFGIISTKIFALYTGTEGLGILSILRQFRQTGYSISSISGDAAIVQGVARFNNKKRIEYIQSIFLL